VSGPKKTPGTGRGRKRKDAGDEDVPRTTTKRHKRPAAAVAEEEPEEDDAQLVKGEEHRHADEGVD